MITRRESAESAADSRASDRSPPKAYWAVRRGGRREKPAKMQCYLRSQQRVSRMIRARNPARPERGVAPMPHLPEQARLEGVRVHLDLHAEQPLPLAAPHRQEAVRANGPVLGALAPGRRLPSRERRGPDSVLKHLTRVRWPRRHEHAHPRDRASGRRVGAR